MPCSNNINLLRYHHFLSMIVIMSSILLFKVVNGSGVHSKPFLPGREAVNSFTSTANNLLRKFPIETRKNGLRKRHHVDRALAFHTATASSFPTSKLITMNRRRLYVNEEISTIQNKQTSILPVPLSSVLSQPLCKRHFSISKIPRHAIDSNIDDESFHNEDRKVVEHEFDVILNDLNDSQIEAVTQPTQSITRVVAGPGAGKTRVLTCRIAYLLKSEQLNGNGTSRILAVTFTKKAASEMQHRLDSLLREDEEYQKKFNGMIQSNGDEVEDREVDGITEEMAPHDVGNPNHDRAPPVLTTRVTMGTFHSICSKILRWHGNELSKLPSLKNYLPQASDDESEILDGSFTIIDQSEQIRVINECVKTCGIDLKTNVGSQDTIRPITILNTIGQMKSDEALGIIFGGDNQRDEKLSKKKRVRQIAEEVYPLYRKALLSRNSLDFDDLILMTRELLKTNSEVRERMQKRWRHILVDEFQDTSEVQLDLVRLLSTSSLLVVGDADQSIYSWRGAHAESMSDFVKTFNNDCNEGREQKKVNTVFLMENYRSTTNIIKAAQKVISDSSSVPSDQDNMRKDMKPMRGKGPSPRILACADTEAEATFVVKEINKMSEDGTINPSSTVALIYRTNAQSRALEEACVTNNLQYLVRGSVGTFYSRAEIKDSLCFLRWIYNGRDQSAMARAVKTPSRGIGDVSMREFIEYCNEVENQLQDKDHSLPTTPLDILISLTYSDSLFIPPDGIISKRTMNKLVPFATQMKKLKEGAEVQTVSELLQSIIETLGLKSHFNSISKTSEEFADRWSNVNELRGASERYSNDGPCLSQNKVEVDDGEEVLEMSPLGSFLDDVSLLSDVGNDSENDGERRLVVNLMTIHAAKGMEFDCVFLVGNEEGTFPTQRSIMEGNGSIELDEERRLCFVAMTRAKTHLIMTWRREVQTFFGQGFKFTHPERSRFLDKLVAKKSMKQFKKKSQSYGNVSTKRKIGGTSRRGIQTLTRSTKNMAINNSRERNVKTSKRKNPKTDVRKRVSNAPPMSMDSSLFFPVGSVVRHPIHGEGIVLTPKPVSYGGKMMVTVDFKSGMQVDFPIEKAGLTIQN